MLYRKIEEKIKEYFLSKPNKIMIIDGARQIGKSFIIRHVGEKMFKNYVEINFVEDFISNKYFSNLKSVEDFYFQLSSIAGDKLDKDTLIFIDEIQQYPYFLTMLKFLVKDNRFTYICSGSLLEITLSKTTSIPIGSVEIVHMYPLDFEEFLYANGFNKTAIENLHEYYNKRESLSDSIHNRMMDLFKKYLLIGGMPDSINSFLESQNIVKTRNIQSNIYDLYGDDASKYDKENKLKIKRIYEMIPSNLENKKKRLIIQDVEGKKGKRFEQYQDEFDYLVNSGISLEVKALASPVFPLISSSKKNLLKLYLNDVGILTNILFKNNINAVLNDVDSINLGSVYESVVAQELKAHGHELFYYDNKEKGEVDFLIDDYDNLSVLPLEVKSGKDYFIHSALNNFLKTKDYNVKKGIVLSNERKVYEKNNILYLPIYYVMFI